MNHNDDWTVDRCILLYAWHFSKLFANTPDERGSELEVRYRQISLIESKR